MLNIARDLATYKTQTVVCVLYRGREFVAMQQAIAYYRVSTARQGRSGLGIEAQRDAVARFAAAEGFDLIGEFVEVETGRGVMPSTGGLNWPQRWPQGGRRNARSSWPSSTGFPATWPSYRA